MLALWLLAPFVALLMVLGGIKPKIEHGSSAGHDPHRRSKHWALTLWLIAPFAAVVLLVAVIAYRDPSSIRMVAPAVGAGAGNTGGANAIGELLAGNKPTHNAQAPASTAAQPETANLVQPESLPQGFILVVEDKARRATQTSPIYLASNLYSNWNPGSKESMLTAQSDMRWRIELPQPAAWKNAKSGPALAFKFTRGTWDLEELNADLSKPGNRTLAPIDASKLAPGEKPIIELSVASWGDMAAGYKPSAGDEGYPPIAATGDLRRVQIVGGAATAANATRECLVWLPPGYDDPANATTRYPVVYMFDGQNLFAKHAGIPAEWGADETATKLIAEKKTPPFIIVGIPHGGPARLSEYLPVNAIPGAAKPAGPAFMDFVLSQVKPRIERAFRVETNRAKVAVGGSSLGGAMALYAGLTHPNAFGLVLAESLPLRTGDATAWRTWLDKALAERAADGKLPLRVALGFGSFEYGKDPSATPTNEAYAKDLADLKAKLIAAGATDAAVRLAEGKDAEHTEGAWAARLPEHLVFLLGGK
jgi:enterochelin esterase-like enzyme